MRSKAVCRLADQRPLPIKGVSEYSRYNNWRSFVDSISTAACESQNLHKTNRSHGVDQFLIFFHCHDVYQFGVTQFEYFFGVKSLLWLKWCNKELSNNSQILSYYSQFPSHIRHLLRKMRIKVAGPSLPVTYWLPLWYFKVTRILSSHTLA